MPNPPDHGDHGDEGRAAAFFDLDHTLLDMNSGQHYALYEHRKGRIGSLQLARASFWLLLHRFASLDVEAIYRKAALHWRGEDGPRVKAEAAYWFDTYARARLRPGGAAALQAHRAHGQALVLVTNSTEFIAAAACAAWNMDAWLANVIPLDEQGRISGQLETPLCYGPGKVSKTEAWARTHGISLARSSFYSDSHSDLPLLERVGFPYAVHPDPKLALVAKRRGWPILDWGA